MTTTPGLSTLRRLYALSGNRCAFPECTVPVVDETKSLLADVCHIHAQSKRGPRFDPHLTLNQVHGFENLLLLCRNHHGVVDDPKNMQRFSADELRRMKAVHEGRYAGSLLPEPSSDLLRALLQSSGDRYEDESIHMDFRNAHFQVGGEGGQYLGAGGSGGVVTIVGRTRLPQGATIDLNGQPGRDVGAGGGGGGSLRRIGRPCTEEDLQQGLRACAFLPVHSFQIRDLLSVLGGGWTCFEVTSLPTQAHVHIVAVLDVGIIPKGDLLRLHVNAFDRMGTLSDSKDVDIAVPEADYLAPKVFIGTTLRFEISEPGLWTLRLRAAETVLAEYPLEIRKV